MKFFVQILLLCSSVAMCAAGPDQTSTLRMVSGTIAGQSVSAADPTITVQPGAAITGSYVVQIHSTFGSNAVMAMGVTPSWGSHSTSYSDLGGFSTPADLNRTITLNLTAPSTAGTYYITAAFQGEYTAAQVMSCTNWSNSSGVLWNNGDDVADWSPAIISAANANGNVLVNYAANGNSPRYVPATAITVVVAAPGNYDQTSTLRLISGTIAGQSVSPSNPTITVQPGAAITGSYVVQIHSTFASNAVMAMGVTPSWGSHSTSYSDLGGFSTPTDQNRTITLNLTAPTTPGTYYITAAFQGEYTAAQVMSCTNWSNSSGVLWDNGDDVADWTQSMIDTTNANGNVYANYTANGVVPRYVPATAIKVVVASPPNDAARNSTLRLVSGTIAGQTVSPANPVINVSPGATITGSYVVQIHSTFASNAVMAMGVTPSWEPHSTSFTDLGGFSTPTDQNRTISLNLTAPSTPGTYYIIAAFQGEYTAAQVMSATNWSNSSGVMWDNADDIAAWTAATIDAANANGNVFVDYQANGNVPRYVPATAIKVVVSITPPPGNGPFYFVPLPPCRVADTRNAPGPLGAPAVQGGSVRDFPIPQSSCAVPAGAAAYSMNVTVVPRGTLGYLTIWPSGQSQPLVSTLNSLDGRIKANAAIVPAGTNGDVSVYATNTTDVILDINGYFTSVNSPSALQFYPVAPCRVTDTRQPSGSFGGPTIFSGQSRSFPIPQSNCGIPSTAQAYSVNMTVVPQGSLGYLTTWPSGSNQPLVSTLNALTGGIVANAAIVPAGAYGAISVYASNSTDVVIDINGYFASPSFGGMSFYTVAPCRVLDSRGATGVLAGPSLYGGAARSFPVPSSTCGVPANARAYSLNATVVPQGALGYLTLWPSDGAQPLVSTLNAADGSITSNAAIVPASSAGAVNAYVTNSTDLILDINGYFKP